jgi:branched-chain amino acid transport system substrate-binding protein
MTISRRGLLATSAAAATAPLLPARAQGKPKIRIGQLTDLSGTYRDNTGPTSVACSQEAIDQFMAGGREFEVELISADHQNKPDVASSLARQWLDQGVDVISDVPTSSVALAVSEVCRQKDKIHLNASATVATLTGEQCSPNTIVWSFDTYENARSTAGAMTKRGADSWFILTADYAFGHSLELFGKKFITENGGKVLGSIRYPFPETTDFSSFLLQAASSGAKAIGLANAGLDTQNAIKQAFEFGLNQKMTIAPLLMFLQDVHSLGLKATQGLVTTESFYWDLNDVTRRFAQNILKRTPKNMPNQAQASCYGSVLHYLKTVQQMGAAEAKKSGAATVAAMKKMPTEDDAFGKGSIGINGRGVFPAYLFEVKKPEESKAEWDLYKLLATTPGPEAVRPLSETGCKLVTG